MNNRYYVLRINSNDQDGDTCEICVRMEAQANKVGGIEFDAATLQRGLSREFYTDLFHEGCRCRLLPSYDGVPIQDSIDRELLLYGSLFHIATEGMDLGEKMEIQNKYGTG